jgi:2-polyprenyl-6-methoxyphenol hydroxylase-like FAD-dependent oxidoreductase
MSQLRPEEVGGPVRKTGAVTDVVVIGAGVAGLGTALALGRDGHRVTVLERDATPLPEGPADAFWWDRRGAPQVRHSHMFLARLRNVLRDSYPDVREALLAAGATELTVGEMLPVGMDTTPQPGDEDLAMIACRRTTFEWVLRSKVLEQDHVTFRDGVVVEGLLTDGTRVTGVRTNQGEEISADVVVAANGRRSEFPRWVREAGLGDIEEITEDTGIVYWSRFYKLREGASEPKQEGPIGGDLGYMKFAVFPGDNGTFSVTLATNNDDEVFRQLGKEELFDAVVERLVPTAPWVDPAVSEPITPVHPMAKLLNRVRTVVVDGAPIAPGLLAVGDASVCTNPLYGRGCSLGFVHADLLRDALRAHPDDVVAQAIALHEGTERELMPWYRASVQADARNRRIAHGEASTEDEFFGTILKEVGPAMRTDPVLFRAFMRMFNLLEEPDSLVTNPDLIGRVMEAYQTRDQREPEAPLGPAREELLAALGLAAA